MSGQFFCPDIYFVQTKGHLPPSRISPKIEKFATKRPLRFIKICQFYFVLKSSGWMVTDGGYLIS